MHKLLIILFELKDKTNIVVIFMLIIFALYISFNQMLHPLYLELLTDRWPYFCPFYQIVHNLELILYNVKVNVRVQQQQRYWFGELDNLFLQFILYKYKPFQIIFVFIVVFLNLLFLQVLAMTGHWLTNLLMTFQYSQQCYFGLSRCFFPLDQLYNLNIVKIQVLIKTYFVRLD